MLSDWNIPWSRLYLILIFAEHCVTYMIPDYFRGSLSLSPSLSRTNMHIQHTLTHFTKFSLAVVFQQTTAWEPIGKVPHTPNTAYHAQTCTYSTLLHISTVRISFCALYALLVILYYVVEVADCIPSSSWSFYSGSLFRCFRYIVENRLTRMTPASILAGHLWEYQRGV